MSQLFEHIWIPNFCSSLYLIKLPSAFSSAKWPEKDAWSPWASPFKGIIAKHCPCPVVSSIAQHCWEPFKGFPQGSLPACVRITKQPLHTALTFGRAELVRGNVLGLTVFHLCKVYFSAWYCMILLCRLICSIHEHLISDLSYIVIERGQCLRTYAHAG